MRFRPSPDVLEDRQLLSFGGGNIDASIPRFPSTSPALNFTSNSFHQINATVPSIATGIASNPSNVGTLLSTYVSHIPNGSTTLFPILATDVINFEKGEVSFSTTGATNEVNSLYVTLLGRPADSVGRADDLKALQNGATVTQIADGIAQSNEFIQGNITSGGSPNANQTQLVTALYDKVLGRSADAAGLTYWINQLNTSALTPAQVAHDFVSSAEAATSTTSVVQSGLNSSIDTLYFNLLGRPADSVGRADDLKALQNGATVTQIADGIAQSNEFIQGNITSGGSPNANQTQLVTALYAKVLGRSADGAGLNYWVNQLNTSALTPTQVAHHFVSSTEAATSTTSVLQNAAIFTPAGAAYYFGMVTPGGPITGNFPGIGATAQLENLIQKDTLAYLANGIGNSFNILKSGVNYASDSLLTYNGKV